MDQLIYFFDNIINNVFGSFNLMSLLDYINKPFYVLFWIFLKNGGFVLFALLLLWVIKQYYMDNLLGKFFAKGKKICLSINIPKNNVQTPKSVESIFTQISATFAKANFKEKYFDGKGTDTYSFEIVSLNGYIQFIIQLPAGARDYVESGIFAQYPNAEIIEIPDYTKNFPQEFPSEGWDMWGMELGPKGAGMDYYMIKTYSDFIDKDAEEFRFKDPLAGVLEIMSKLKNGENLCFQVLVRARDVEANKKFIEGGRKEINKIIGVKEPASAAKNGIFGSIGNSAIGTIIKDFFSMLIYSEVSTSPEAKKEEKSDTAGWAMKILPDQKLKIELIDRKLSKPIFECKVRIMYIGKKEVFNKGRIISGSFGAIFQFNHMSGMQLLPNADSGTGVQKYFFPVERKVVKRQNNFIKGYVGRSLFRGGDKFVMNVEELASLFHFPPESVQTPMMTKVESKKVEPPMDLPTIE